MAALDDPKTLGRTRLSFASEADIDEFVDMLARFERGEIGARRVARVPPRCAAPTASARPTTRRCCASRSRRACSTARSSTRSPTSPSATRAASATSRRGRTSSSTSSSCTTSSRRCGSSPTAGLTTREACGNSVRNITACPYAGVSADEVFDVTPYAEALTRYLLRHPLSSSLPRKFKIALRGLHRGSRARRDQRHRLARAASATTATRGFRVTVGGGTAIYAVSGRLLHDFLPVGRDARRAPRPSCACSTASATTSTSSRNRMKFLIKSLGWDGFRAEYDARVRARCAETGGVAAAVRSGEPAGRGARRPGRAPPRRRSARSRQRAASSRTSRARASCRRCGRSSTVHRRELRARGAHQRPARRSRPATRAVTVTVAARRPHRRADARCSRDLSPAYGDGTVRVTLDQNLVFRWVPTAQRATRSTGGSRRRASALADAGTIADVTSCPGAESCRLAVTQSRGLGRLLGEHLRARPDLVDAAPDVAHQDQRLPERLRPAPHRRHRLPGQRPQGRRRAPCRSTSCWSAAASAPTGARFGRLAAKIPARRGARGARAADRALRQRAARRRERRPRSSAASSSTRVKRALADLERLTPPTRRPRTSSTSARSREFTPEVMEGECSA